MHHFARYPIAALLLAGAAAGSAQVVKYPTTPPGRILSGVAVGPKSDMLFLSGQLASPIDPAKPMTPATMTTADYGDTKTQTVSTLNKIKGLLAAHGYAMADIVKMTVFVAGDPAKGGKMDFDGLNAGFGQFFGTPDNPTTVARSAFQVAALAAPAFLVEIEVVAAK